MLNFKFLFVFLIFFIGIGGIYSYEARKFPEEIPFWKFSSQSEIPCLNIKCLQWYVKKVFAGTTEGFHVYKLGKWESYNGVSAEEKKGKVTIVPGNIPQLNNNSVNDIKELNGDLWIGTDDGLFCFSYFTDQIRKIKFPEKFNLSDPIKIQSVESVGTGENARLIVAVFPGKLFQVHSKKETVVSLGEVDCQWITDMVLVKNMLFIGTQYNGLFYMNIESEELHPVQVGKDAVQEKKVNFLSFDNEGNIFIASEAGPYMVPLENLQARNICSYFEIKNLLHVKSILGENSKKIWIGTEQGLWVLENDSLNSVSGMEDFYITEIIATDDSLFIGTLNNGIYSIKRK